MKKSRKLFVAVIILILLGLGFLFNHIKENQDEPDFMSIENYNERYNKTPDEE